MLLKRAPELNEIVWAAEAEVGGNPGRITDAILAEHFPRTQAEAQVEGVEKLLRNGLLFEVKRILRTNCGDDRQTDFGEIDAAFRPFVHALKRPSYWVESREELVSVAVLIESPVLLDDARQFMRRKGNECLDEATRLDALWLAVTTGAA